MVDNKDNVIIFFSEVRKLIAIQVSCVNKPTLTHKNNN